MTPTLYRSTTALLLVISLSAPGAVGAQQTGGAAELTLPPELAGLVGTADVPRVDGAIQICALGHPVPCVLPTGDATTVEGLATEAAQSEEHQALGRLLARIDAAARAEPDAAPQVGAAGNAVDGGATGGETIVVETPATDKPRTGADLGTGANTAAETQAQTGTPVPGAEEPVRNAQAPVPGAVAEVEPARDQAAAPVEGLEPQAEAVAGGDADAAAPPQAGGDVTVITAPQEDTPRTGADLEAGANTAAETQAQTGMPVPGADEPVRNAEAPVPGARAEPDDTRNEAAVAAPPVDNLGERAPPPGQPNAAVMAPAEPGEADPPVAEAQAQRAAGETLDADLAAGLTEDAAGAEAARQARLAARAAKAAATDADGAPMADVQEETVADADVRRSTEEFVQSPAGTRRSTAETLALLGLGAILGGALLDNGDEIVAAAPDRAVARRDDGSIYLLRDDDTLLRQPGSRVETRDFGDGSRITIITRDDGSEVRTVRDAAGRVLRRTRVLADGTSVVLFDDTRPVETVDVARLPRAPAPSIEFGPNVDLAAALRAVPAYDAGRAFSLGQIRDIRVVRELVPTLELSTLTFDTGSSAIRPDQAETLVELGTALRAMIDESPNEVFLIEGHTDAVGDASANLTLSDRRAESLALALSEYFDVPPENLIVQGYGESYLKVPTLEAERENRRVAVRRITPLLTAEAG